MVRELLAIPSPVCDVSKCQDKKMTFSIDFLEKK